MIADLAAALADVLSAEIVTDLVRLSGGASRDTFRFQADGRSLILQRQRVGDVRDMGNEALVVRTAGAGGVPVAKVVGASTDPSALGGAFMVLTAVEGETIARKILRDDRYGHARSVLAAQLGAALARLHAVDASPLSSLPMTDQVSQYREVLEQLAQPHPTFELVFKWLAAHRHLVASDVEDFGELRVHG